MIIWKPKVKPGTKLQTPQLLPQLELPWRVVVRQYLTYYLLIPIINYFRFGEDLLDYHERDFFQGKSDRDKVLTVNNMSPSKEEYESYTCIERSQTDGAILSVEVNSHGQNGLYFDKLSVFKSEAALIDHYKNMMYDPVGNQLTPIEGHFITDGEKIISHSELDLIKFFDRYIEPRLETT